MADVTVNGLFYCRGSFSLTIDSLIVEKGDKIAILGENGCGKTTLLQLLAGVLKPLKGEILPLCNMRFAERADKIGYLPQEATVLFNLTVSELLRLNLTGKRVMDDASYNVMFQTLDLHRFKDRGYYSMSGGEKRRAMIGRALALDTDILLLDEPTAPLDLRHTRAVLSYLHSTSKTVIASIHDINSAVRYFDKILLMKNGKIIFFDNKDALTSEVLSEVYDVQIRSCSDHYIVQY